MTTSPPQTRSHGPGRAVGHDDDTVLTLADQAARLRPRAGWFARHPEWPIAVLLVGWPVWWFLGILTFAGALLGTPAAWRLYKWRATGTRTIRTPPRFGIWLLFLIVMVLGLSTIALTAPTTLASPVSNRVVSWGLRAWSYFGATSLLLYAGNLTERELPRRRLAWMLGIVGVYTVAGGILGTVFPKVTFKSPLAYLVPQSFQSAHNNLASLYPSFAQVQNLLGYAHGRPDAPFSYTNMWGNCLAILLPWLLVAGWCYGTRRQRWFTAAVFVLAFIPVISSLDRGLWVGVGVIVLYVAVRLAARGKLAMLAAVAGVIALAGAVILFTPVQSLISQRLSHGTSNVGRADGTRQALQLGLESPIIGWGDTRHETGSTGSIAIGPTASCKTCGAKSLGGDGELQTLLITTGLVGAAFYVAFFAYGIWRYRRDPTPYGMAGVLVLVLGMVFMFVYDATGPPLSFTMLAYALLWRNETERHLDDTHAPPGTNGHGAAITTGKRRMPSIGPGRRGPAAEFNSPRPAPAVPGPPGPTSHVPGPPGAASRAAGGERRGQAGSVRLAELARGGTLNLVGAAVAAVMTVGVTVLVTRHFSRYAAGSFFAATSAFVIVEYLGTLGVANGLVYFTARLRSLGEDVWIPNILRIALAPVVVASVALGLVMLLFANPLAHLLLSSYHKGSGGSTHQVAVALRWLAVLVPFGALETALLGATRGYHDMRPTVVVDRMGVSAAQLLAVVVAAGAGATAYLAPLWALPYLPATVAAWFWLRRIRRRPGPPRTAALPDVPPKLAALRAPARPSPPSLGATADRAARPARSGDATLGRVARKRLARATRRDFWRFTTPRGVATVTSAIIQRVDIVIIAIMRGPVDAAIYTAATRFLVLGQFAGQAISRASQPQLTELFTLDDHRGTNVVYQATTAWLILLTWPLYLLVLVYGQQVLAIFGHSYRAGYAVMVVLSLAQLAGAIFGQVDVVLIMAGKSSWSMLNGLLVLTTNVGLDLWLIPKLGILGAAIAWATAITVSNVVPLIQLALVFRLHPVSRGGLIAAALTAVSFCAVPLAVHAALGGGWASLAVGVVAGTILMGAGLMRLRGPLRLQGVPMLRRLPSRA